MTKGQKTTLPPPPTGEQQGNPLMHWLDHRTGIRAILRMALEEPIPGGARWAYVFGSGLLFLFLSQVITGVFLVFYYVPSADHAHTTVAYIAKEVTTGSFLRSIHAYGSSAIVVVLLLHIAQTFFYGSYKKHRELLWLAGCVLFALMLGMAFTGYLLPWDQKAYFATTVGTNIMSEMPIVGEWLKRLVRGGTEMGTLTLSRFFVLHVFLLPAMIFTFVSLHVFLFRRAGAAGHVTDVLEDELPSENFYPRQVAMDMVFALLLITALGIFAHLSPAELGPKANPADTQYLPRPEWYYIPMFQWLKYWHGPSAIIGILVIPTVLAVLFAGLPFYDKRLERRPWRRPISVSAFIAVFVALGLLGFESYRSDARDPAVAAQLKQQRVEVDAFMKARFEPELDPMSLASMKSVVADPIVAQGKVLFESQGCNVCHGDHGEGTAAAPKLLGIAAKYDVNRLPAVLKSPNKAMSSGGMEAVKLGESDMRSLVAYVHSLK